MPRVHPQDLKVGQHIVSVDDSYDGRLKMLVFGYVANVEAWGWLVIVEVARSADILGNRRNWYDLKLNRWDWVVVGEV